MELIELLRMMREEKRKSKTKPEVFLLTTIQARYGKDPLPELRELWRKGVVKSCHTLNHLAFMLIDGG